MSGTHYPYVDDDSLADAASSGAAADSARVPWWRHLAVVLLLAALARVGLYFAGLVGLLIFLTDLRRHPYTRLGGSLVIAWWTFVWARASVPPLTGLALMLAAGAAYAVASWQQLRQPAAAARNAALAGAAVVLALLNVVPYGMRAAKLDKAQALARAVAVSRGDVHATDAQVAKTRARFDQRPVYLVLLFEPNANAATTSDGEPCFRREEVHVVDGIDGTVDRRGLIDRLMLTPNSYQLAEARKKDGNCLPLPRGTRKDVVRIPGR
jgi:hypothetical protein